MNWNVCGEMRILPCRRGTAPRYSKSGASQRPRSSLWRAATARDSAISITQRPIGLADDSILTPETIEHGTAMLVNAAELGDGKSAMAESAVRWLRLAYPLFV